jgi:hypothetical protein
MSGTKIAKLEREEKKSTLDERLARTIMQNKKNKEGLGERMINGI